MRIFFVVIFSFCISCEVKAKGYHQGRPAAFLSLSRAGALGNSSDAVELPLSPNDDLEYKIISERVAYDNYRTLMVRQVKHPISKRKFSFDLTTHRNNAAAVTIVAFNTTSKTFTLVKEYHPGPHRRLFGPAAGLVDSDKHVSEHQDMELVAAQWELEEELHLQGGQWVKLLQEPHFMDKYVTCQVTPFLCLDPKKMPAGQTKPRDAEEEHDLEIIPNVTVQQMKAMIARGKMNLVGAWACMLALDKLESMGQI